jgi:hypothetical protein
VFAVHITELNVNITVLGVKYIHIAEFTVHICSRVYNVTFFWVAVWKSRIGGSFLLGGLSRTESRHQA